MANKAEKPAAAAPEAEAATAPAKKKLPLMMIVTALAVVLLEGGTVFVTMKAAGGPKRAVAEVPATQPAEPVEKDAELSIIDAKLPNNQTGHLFLYDLEVVAKVSEKNKVKVNELLTQRAAQIKDRIRTIIASSDPKNLGEPGLETLRRQISYQLEQDVGPEMIKELLIPKCTPFRAEF